MKNLTSPDPKSAGAQSPTPELCDVDFCVQAASFTVFCYSGLRLTQQVRQTRQETKSQVRAAEQGKLERRLGCTVLCMLGPHGPLQDLLLGQ
jgi:hypothetical protein